MSCFCLLHRYCSSVSIIPVGGPYRFVHAHSLQHSVQSKYKLHKWTDNKIIILFFFATALFNMFCILRKHCTNPRSTRGWYPKEASKGDMQVAELVRELWAYSIQVHAGLLAAMQPRAASSSWLSHSFCPLE